MIVWLEKALALAIHDRQVAEHGGGAGVRDDGLLESALARPQQLHAYGAPAPDLADLAAALAYGLARQRWIARCQFIARIVGWGRRRFKRLRTRRRLVVPAHSRPRSSCGILACATIRTR